MGNNTVINTRFTKTEITPYDVKYLVPAHILLNEPELNNSKTPRLVIKFSKSPSSNVARSGTTENGGRDEYDFDDNAGPGPPSRGPSPGGASARDKLSSFGAMLTSSVDGTVDSSSVNNSPLTNEQIVTNQPTVKVAKLKIKI